MAERESSVVDKPKTDFLNRVQTVKSEIRTKFLNLRKDLDDQELRALEKVEKIEREILEECERASASLKEISQVRDGIVAGLKSNTANDLLKKSLEMYDKEIEQIKLDSNIDSTIELVWKLEQLPLNLFKDICEVLFITRSEQMQQQDLQQQQQEELPIIQRIHQKLQRQDQLLEQLIDTLK